MIKTFPDALLLMGHDGQDFSTVRYDDYGSIYAAATKPIGTCYAAHTLLENTLGVRWYYPSEEVGQVAPTSAHVVVKNLNIRRRPDAPVRSIYPLFINTERLYFTEWDQPQKFQSSWVNARTSLLYWIRNRFWGGMRHNANHSFSYYDRAFGQSHPEWFSSKSYVRMKQLNYQTEVQPCLTAPGFADQVVQIARDYFDGKPEPFPGAYRSATGHFFSVMPNDNTNMCGCPECRAQYRKDVGPDGNAGHYVWGFVNRVAREVKKTHPRAMISNCAYFNYTSPPHGMIFESNVAVEFCKFYTEYSNRNYQERDYRRIAEYAHQNNVEFFTTWEYLLKPHITEWAFPCLAPHVHADDVRRLHDIDGFRGGKLQFLYMGTYAGDKATGGVAQVSPVLDFMNLYWRMKLYDDATLDIEQALDEYYRAFFGPGSEDMKAFYTAIEDRWMTLGGGHDSRTWWGKLGTPEFLKEVGGHIDEARQATAAGTIYRKRVELIDAGILQHLLKARVRYEKSAISELVPLGTAGVAHAGTAASRDDWADDATWADAPVNEIQKTLNNEPVSQKTVFKLAWGEEHLYVYARCLEPNVSQMKADTLDNDVGGFSDDSIELFVDPSGKGETYYQFCINSRGAVYDALENPTAIGATATVSWDSDIKVQTTIGKDAWELRAALPLASLVKQPPRPGSTWRFNLCRNRFAEPGKPPYSAWSPTPAGFRDPRRFGIITFNATEDHGRTVWNCDFESTAFESQSGESPLIGRDGWYENTAYANRGWDRSWKVVDRGGNRLAACDINSTCPSDVVPMYAVQVSPGVVSVEVDFRRLATHNQPALAVTAANGKRIGYLYGWAGRSDLVAIEQPGDRQNYGHAQHGLREFSKPDQWFGLKLVIDTAQRNITGFVRSGRGEWVALNNEPLPYYNPEADGTPLFLSFGTYKQKTIDNNVLEMDNIRVIQLSRDE
ncbi:MAG: hypothetical protein CMJ64_15145 [Planctomycetaceae bacterium]|nr:hypothetical protein [Planctomycetaceae bacterium]